jgi:hypothetical protein
MGIVAMSVTLAMAAVLLWAALEKARSLSSVASTLREVGVPGSWSNNAARLLIAAELFVAIGLIIRPGSAVTITGVLGLATAFAVAGLVALQWKRTIQCRCFGPYGGETLGKNQLTAFPLWLAGASIVWLQPQTQSYDVQPAVSFAVVGLTLAALRGVHVMRISQQARADRRSAQEMFIWLSR